MNNFRLFLTNFETVQKLPKIPHINKIQMWESTKSYQLVAKLVAGDQFSPLPMSNYDQFVYKMAPFVSSF
jgi:hypothetical protein